MSDNERRETVKEAKILEVLSHPNIVKFIEVFKTKNGNRDLSLPLLKFPGLKTKRNGRTLKQKRRVYRLITPFGGSAPANEGENPRTSTTCVRRHPWIFTMFWSLSPCYEKKVDKQLIE